MRLSAIPNSQRYSLLCWLFAGMLLAGCISKPREPVACVQIRTVSYEAGVITTTLRLSPQPTVGDVLRCFGKPDAYLIARRPASDSAGPGSEFDMIYPSRGLIFSHS